VVFGGRSKDDRKLGTFKYVGHILMFNGTFLEAGYSYMTFKNEATNMKSRKRK
jgi:hypothetical protein